MNGKDSTDSPFEGGCFPPLFDEERYRFEARRRFVETTLSRMSSAERERTEKMFHLLTGKRLVPFLAEEG